MFIPKTFKNDDSAQLRKLIESKPLATLVCDTNQGLEANHIPLLLDESKGKIALLGHIAKGNPLHELACDGQPALAIFQGPEAYVSAGYYPSKQRDPKVVPTWNYTAVHSRGTLHFFNDKSKLLSLVDALTHSQERDQERPWSIQDAPSDYIDRMLSAIIGIEIAVESLEGKWKVSQNQSQENQAGVVQAMRRRNHKDMADEILGQSPAN